MNIYPSAIDNLIWAIPLVTEYRVTVEKRGEMGELVIEIEVGSPVSAEQVQSEVNDSISNNFSLRPTIKLVQTNSLPGFDMKGKRFFINH